MTHPIDAKTRLVTLLGHPLSHSLSPLIHNAAFRAQGFNMAYLCMAVPPADLPAAVEGFRAARFVGSNVTIPHKEAIFRIVDSLSEQARAVGAVNTIVCRDAGDGSRPTLHGDNTDIAGFLAPIAAHRDALDGCEAVVFGSGGSARAVVYAILSALAPAQLVIAARSIDKAEALADAFAGVDTRGALRVTPLADAAPAVRRAHLLVNTTPLGMHPHVEATPWPAAADFSPGQHCYDLVYNPLRTRFLRDAARQGAVGIGGLDMLIEQAAASYVQWTGRDMPRGAVREALSPILMAGAQPA